MVTAYWYRNQFSELALFGVRVLSRLENDEAALLASEQRQELLAAVEALPRDQRDTIACRYFLDLSEEETAQVLGVRRGTVKSRTARALERLRGMA